MNNLKCLDDIVLGENSNNYLRKEMEKYASLIERYNKYEQISVWLESILRTIVNNSPDLENNKWKFDGKDWIIIDEYNFLDRDSLKIHFEDIDNFFKLLGIKYSYEKNSYCDDYTFIYTISFDEYNKIKEYYDKLNNITDERLKHKLLNLEIESWPDWKKQYVEDNFTKSNYVKKLCNNKDTN